jgi:gag-polypeptide of LTR copia-type
VLYSLSWQLREYNTQLAFCTHLSTHGAMEGHACQTRDGQIPTFKRSKPPRQTNPIPQHQTTPPLPAWNTCSADFDNFIAAAISGANGEPGLLYEARSHPDWNLWKEAMDRQYDTLQRVGTWETVRRLEGRNIVGFPQNERAGTPENKRSLPSPISPNIRGISNGISARSNDAPNQPSSAQLAFPSKSQTLSLQEAAGILPSPAASSTGHRPGYSLSSINSSAHVTASSPLSGVRSADLSAKKLNQYMTAQSRWSRVNDEFTAKSVYAQNDLEQAFFELRCPKGGDVRTFLTSLRYKREELAAAGVRVTSKEYQRTVLRGLPDELAKFASQLLSAARITHGGSTFIIDRIRSSTISARRQSA